MPLTALGGIIFRNRFAERFGELGLMDPSGRSGQARASGKGEMARVAAPWRAGASRAKAGLP